MNKDRSIGETFSRTLVALAATAGPYLGKDSNKPSQLPDRQPQVIFLQENEPASSTERIDLAADLLPTNTPDIINNPQVVASLQGISGELSSLRQLTNPNGYESEYVINVVSARLEEGIAVTYVIQKDSTVYLKDAFTGVYIPVNTEILPADVFVINENGFDRLISAVRLPNGEVAEMIHDETGEIVGFRPLDEARLLRTYKQLVAQVSDAVNITNYTVNIRAEASTQGDILGTLPPHSPLLVTGARETNSQGEEWLPVNVDGVIGWVRSDMIAPQRSENPQSPSLQVTPEAGEIVLAMFNSASENVNSDNEAAEVQNMDNQSSSAPLENYADINHPEYETYNAITSLYPGGNIDEVLAFAQENNLVITKWNEEFHALEGITSSGETIYYMFNLGTESGERERFDDLRDGWVRYGGKLIDSTDLTINLFTSVNASWKDKNFVITLNPNNPFYYNSQAAEIMKNNILSVFPYLRGSQLNIIVIADDITRLGTSIDNVRANLSELGYTMNGGQTRRSYTSRVLQIGSTYFSHVSLSSHDREIDDGSNRNYVGWYATEVMGYSLMPLMLSDMYDNSLSISALNNQQWLVNQICRSVFPDLISSANILIASPVSELDLN